MPVEYEAIKPPQGFKPAHSRGAFTTLNGPVFRAIDPADTRSGIWVLDRHCNGMGFMHGGMTSAFADGALAWAVWKATRKSSVTLKLTMQYFATIRPGKWLEAHPKVVSVHEDVVHLEAEVMIGGVALAARADATFRTLRRTAK